MDTCTYLGIYPNNIEAASETFEAVCERFGLDSDKIWGYVLRDFIEEYGPNFGNRVICLMFGWLESMIQDSGEHCGKVEYYINGLDTSFYYDGEEIA